MMTDNPNIVDVTADTFMAEVIEKSKDIPVLLDFWADWCEPCKNLTPILHDIIEQHPGQLMLAKVNTDQEQMLAQQMGVQSLPTVALLKDGQIVDNFMGVKPKSEIITWLTEHITLGAVEAEPEVNTDVQVLIEAEQYEAALAALMELPQEQAVWQMIEVHLLMNNIDAAQKLYDGLSEEQLKLPESDQAKAKIQLAGVDANDQLAGIKQQITQGRVEPAIEALLVLLQQQKDDADVRQLLLSSFSLLGDAKLAAKYRRRMGSLLN
ncbi:thioredoxin [Marinicella sp. S1101]|uniref:thioredoxin n=1 Tax=Marinicella marina TaxID=2996016 RepID=UPI002260B809|nr:thioredoxin [Marinicella marina]MCX7553840.1 thioredoxin [Marinicella marina]MDJ1140916.1 thioredoxin [Marinicella marina]